MTATSRRRAVAAALLLLVPLPAHAHLVQTGFGSFYDGMAHFVVSVVGVLVVVASALFMGAQGAASARPALLVAQATWLIAATAGLISAGAVAATWPSAVGFALLGLVVASGARLPRWLVVIVSAVIAGWEGNRFGRELAADGEDWLALLGVTVLVGVVWTVGSAVVIRQRTEVGRIVVRVVASWLAAIGILMLGWTARSHLPRRAPAQIGYHAPLVPLGR